MKKMVMFYRVLGANKIQIYNDTKLEQEVPIKSFYDILTIAKENDIKDVMIKGNKKFISEKVKEIKEIELSKYETNDIQITIL